MKYFLLQADDKNQIPRTFNICNTINIQDIHKDRAHRLPTRSIIRMRSTNEMFFPDILSWPFFLVSKECAEVVSMYEYDITYHYVKLYSEEDDQNATYYIPILDELDCLSEESEFNLNRSLIMKIVLKKNAIRERSIFRIAGFDESYIIARMDLVESILRRGALGIKLTEVEVV